MRKVIIIGPGGAGKSTLARELGVLTGLPVIHLDAEHWRAGWVETPVDEWQQRVRELVAGDRWIIDGNYGGTLDLRLAAADTVIFLDFPRLLCITRAVRRRLRYLGRTRPDMAPGCPERISPEFLRWIWEYRRKKAPGIRARMRTLASGARHYVLRSPAEVRAFLRQVPPSS